MRAALVASARSRGGCTAAIRSCSALVAYRSWLVTPWSIQTACCGIVFEPTLTSRRLAVAKDGPRILSSLSIFPSPRRACEEGRSYHPGSLCSTCDDWTTLRTELARGPQTVRLLHSV